MVLASVAHPANRDFAFLSGGGEVGQLISSFDWAATSLGPIANWPQSLKTTVSFILRSQVPIVTLWGADGVMIYNDAYSCFAGAKHPRILGSKVREGWPEVADFNDNVMKVVLSGKTLAYRDQELTLDRSGKPESVWMNLDYSPILDETGVPAAVIAIVVETTDKVDAERALIAERDRQRQMFEQAPGFMTMLTGPDHVFELMNTAYMQLVGHRDILGKTVREALPELDGQAYFQLLDTVYETGQAFTGFAMKVELQRTPGGSKEDRYIDLIYQPVKGVNGDVIGIVAQGVDVTDRLLADEALRHSETQFRIFAEAMPNHVWTSTPSGLLDWFNPRVYEYSGASATELEGLGWARIVHPDDLQVATQRWQDSLASGNLYETEFRLRRHDGTYRWHLARAVPIRDENGHLVQWIGTNTDIDEQKKSAQALHESERRLHLSQNAAGIASLEVDVETGTVLGSSGLWGLWGLSPRDSVHISVLENIVIPDDRHIRSNPQTRREGSAPANVEYRIRRPDNGEIRWLSRHIDFVFDDSGKPIKMFGVMQDITDRKEAQTRQEILTHELEHRIKNILAMVSAIASQTLRNTDITTARTTFSERLRALANAHDILNSTRWTSASMRQVIDNTIAAFPVEQISIAGPALAINPKMALSMALAVNELGTNALKYGALSTPSGRVTIQWSLDDSAESPGGKILTWRWTELGGPAVNEPQRRGFGSFLIERVFGADFGGSVKIDYHPHGVECVLTAAMPSASSSAAIRN